MDSYFCRKFVKDFRLRKFKNIGIFDIYASGAQENAIPKYNLLHKTLIDKGNIKVADNLLSSLLDNSYRHVDDINIEICHVSIQLLDAAMRTFTTVCTSKAQRFRDPILLAQQGSSQEMEGKWEPVTGSSI